MKLTIESYRAIDAFGIDGGLKMIKNAGFDGVDLSFYWGATQLLCGDDWREKALEVKSALEKYGLSCSQAHAPFDFLYTMKQDDSCFEYLSIKRAIMACGILGIDHIVVHGVAVPEGSVSRQSINYNLDYYKKLEPLCREYGVKIAVENLSGAFTYPDLMNEILKKLDSPYFIGLVDVGHAWLRAKIQPGDFIRRLDPDVLKGVHIQDNHGAELGIDEHLVPGLGTVDFEDLIKALRETGYCGDFTMEVPAFLNVYSKAGLLPEAYRFAETVGRKLSEQL